MGEGGGQIKEQRILASITRQLFSRINKLQRPLHLLLLSLQIFSQSW